MDRTYPGHKVRDSLTSAFRTALMQKMGVVPYLHQARFFAYADSKILDPLTAFEPADLLPEVPESLPRVVRASGAEFWLVRRPVFTRREYARFGEIASDDFPTYHDDDGSPITRDLYYQVTPSDYKDVIAITAAYKIGKSVLEGVCGASVMIVPDAQVRIIGMEYRVARNEYEYLLDALLSEKGAALPDYRTGTAHKNVLGYVRYLNNPDKGQMMLELSNGAKVECRTWERSHALKGEEVDLYVWSEYYQFQGIESLLEIRQNLAARHGRNIIATTPDRPHVEEVIERARSKDPTYASWACVTDIPRRENPLAFSFDKMLEEMGSRTKEKWLIHWEGKTGEYVGSVYDYIRGQRVFNTQTHPYLWKNPHGQPTPDNLQIPGHYLRVCGFDTGTYTAAAPCVFDEHGCVFFVGEFCNYRYVGGTIEGLDHVMMPDMAFRLHEFIDAIGGTWPYPADWNSQFKDEWRGHGFHFRNGERAPDLRTERTREFFQHDKAFFAPWLSVLPYEVERARFPDSPNSAGRLIRLSENDHLLDAAEHACATVKRKTAEGPKDAKRYGRFIDKFLDSDRKAKPKGLFIDALLGE